MSLGQPIFANISFDNHPLDNYRPRVIPRNTGRDGFDPYIHRRHNYLKDDYRNAGGVFDNIGLLIPAENMILREDLYASAIGTPKGRFISWIAIRNAFRQGWKFVQEKKKRTPLKSQLHDRLIELTSRYNLKKYFTLAKSTAAIFGRSLLFRRQIAPFGKRKKWEIRVTPIWEEHIDYANGVPRVFHPIIPFERGLRQFDINAEDAVLWLNQVDIFGNGYQGVPELIGAFRTIVRSEGIAESFAELVEQKGLGQLDIEIADARDQQDVEAWAEVYKKLVQDSIVVHSPDMKTEVIPGIHSGYNYPETQNSYYEDFSASTGVPQMRVRGVQTGTVTGSEVDQDNMAEVYSTIQESCEEYMKEFYFILDPDLAFQPFEIDWEFNIKMDRKGRSAVLATDINTVLTGAEIFTVNQAFEILELPLLKNEEQGNMLLQEWIDINFGRNEPIEPSQESLPGEHSEEVSNAKKRYEEMPLKENEYNQLMSLLKGPAENKPARDEWDKLVLETLDGFIPKDTIIRALLKAGISARMGNKVLRNLYRSGGTSPNRFNQIKGELL